MIKNYFATGALGVAGAAAGAGAAWEAGILSKMDSGLLCAAITPRARLVAMKQAARTDVPLVKKLAEALPDMKDPPPPPPRPLSPSLPVFWIRIRPIIATIMSRWTTKSSVYMCFTD